MCCDSRRPVRQTGITYLQRALLAYDLHDLSGLEWYACFLEVHLCVCLCECPPWLYGCDCIHVCVCVCNTVKGTPIFCSSPLIDVLSNAVTSPWQH